METTIMMLTTIIVALITAVFGPIAVEWAKNYFPKKKAKINPVDEAIHLNTLVDEQLDFIMEELGADRVWVAQFHNGGHFYPTGKSMAKFSIIYESVGSNTNSVQLNFQNIPVNLFSRSINQLLENDVIEIPDFKDETIATYGLKYIAEDTGCKSGYLFAIKTIDDKFIGVLGLDYTKRKTKLDIESINHISNHAASIGGVLMGHLNT